MLKLTKQELATLADVAPKVAELFQQLEVEREMFTGTVQRLTEQINELQVEAFEVMDDAARSAEDYYDGKSEKWQEGERGSAYAEWRDRLREIADGLGENFEALEVAEIDEPGWLNDINDSEPDWAEFE